MEFYLEPSGSITISRGDILLSTTNNYITLYITTVMVDLNETVFFTAADNVVTGDLYFTTGGRIKVYCHDDRMFEMLRDSVSTDTWHPVPRTKWDEITALIKSHIY